MAGLFTLRPAEVARALNVGERTVYDAICRDEIPNVGIGRRRSIPKAWVAERLGISVEQLTADLTSSQ